VSLRLSVTELDAYRYYRENEDASLDDLLAQLRRETPPTRAMQAGSAWHKVLEQCAWSEADAAACDGFTFRIVGDLELCLPEVRELKGEMELDTPCGPVTLVGVVDGLDERGIHDYKLTSRFDAERYTEAWQWRCYLRMFGAERFVYDVFTAREDERAGEWVITAYDQLPFYAYPNLRADVERAVSDFAAFIAAYLPERQQPALAGAH